MKVRRLGGHGELSRNKMEGPHNESTGVDGASCNG